MSTLAKQARAATGLTQQEFSNLLGVNTMTVSRWETGKLALSARDTEVVARVLKGCARHGDPVAVSRMIHESLQGDYLTALAVLLIDGAYAR